MPNQQKIYETKLGFPRTQDSNTKKKKTQSSPIYFTLIGASLWIKTNVDGWEKKSSTTYIVIKVAGDWTLINFQISDWNHKSTNHQFCNVIFFVKMHSSALSAIHSRCLRGRISFQLSHAPNLDQRAHGVFIVRCSLSTRHFSTAPSDM